MRERSRNGEDSFVEFVNQARPQLSRLGWLLTSDVHLAQDLVQEALVRTYLAWSRVRPGEEVGYVRKVMVNLSVDNWRRRRPEVLGGVPERPRPHDVHAQVDDSDEIVRALAGLTARERSMVVLRYYADLSEQQVADELGVSPGTVKSTTSRALARLRAASAERTA